ncbi:unnamed protein product, partial [Bubo scandiacus]
CLILGHASVSAASGSVFSAAGEKCNLPFSVFLIISVPVFNSNLAILAFAAFIVNAYSSTHRSNLKSKMQEIHLSRSVFSKYSFACMCEISTCKIPISSCASLASAYQGPWAG